jgi:hypothetical protein
MLEDPTLFVRSALVPPSYLDRFRHAGVDRFKITDRGSSTATLMATLRAYGTPDLDANLYDVVFKAGSKLKLGLRGLFPDAFIVGLEIPKMSIDGRRFHEVGFIERQPQMSADEQQALASTIVSVDDPPHLRRYLGFIEAVSAKLGWRTSIPRSELAEFDALRSLLDP